MDITVALEGYDTVSKHLSGSRHERDVLIRLSPVRADVDIAVDPPTATVSLDDKPLEGSPPYHVAGLAPGSHVVSAVAPGYAPDERVFDVTSSEPVSLALALQREPEKTPTPAAQKGSTGNTSTAEHPTAGKQTAVAKGTSKQQGSKGAEERGTTTKGGGKQTIARAVPPPSTTSTNKVDKKQDNGAPPADDKPPGYLTINAFPYAVVEIDGTRIKTTPLIRHKLAPGPHKVTLTTEDGKTKTLDIDIQSGATLKKIVRFDASP